MPRDRTGLGHGLLRKPRIDGMVADELRFLVVTVDRASVARSCGKQVLPGEHHFFLTTNLGASFQMKELMMP